MGASRTVEPIGWRQTIGALSLWLLGSVWTTPAAAQLARFPAVSRAISAEAQSSSAGDPLLRVLLWEGPMLELAAAAGPLLLRDRAGLLLAQLAPGQSLQVLGDPLSPGDLRWQLSDGSSSGVLSADLWLEPAAAEARLLLQQRQYRGQLQLRRTATSLQAINHIALEAYLPSVVGSEMPPSWPQPALRAQAVAARTYALRQRRQADPFDLRATVSSQVYRGLESETDSTREAVAATRGQVLTYGGQLIEAVFHSSSGGRTEASGELWAQQLPYLVPVADVDDHSPVRSWQERFDPEQLQRLFADIGGLSEVTVLARSATGRLRQVRLQGPRGVLELSGAQLRQRLGLRSTLVDLEVLRPAGGAIYAPEAGPSALLPPSDALAGLPALPALPEPPPTLTLVVRGRGFGHGIGMSQWGAYGLALRGVSYSAILSHYYPGTQLDGFRGP